MTLKMVPSSPGNPITDSPIARPLNSANPNGTLPIGMPPAAATPESRESLEAMTTWRSCC